MKLVRRIIKQTLWFKLHDTLTLNIKAFTTIQNLQIYYEKFRAELTGHRVQPFVEANTAPQECLSSSLPLSSFVLLRSFILSHAQAMFIIRTQLFETLSDENNT